LSDKSSKLNISVKVGTERTFSGGHRNEGGPRQWGGGPLRDEREVWNRLCPRGSWKRPYSQKGKEIRTVTRKKKATTKNGWARGNF